MNIEAMVEQYVKVRDKVESLKAEHKAQLKPYNDAMEKIEGLLLAHFNSTGQDSAKTQAGTAYRQKQTSATISDKPAFMDWLNESGRWDCADVRAAKVSIGEFVDETQAPPPGVNFTSRFVVNIRRG